MENLKLQYDNLTSGSGIIATVTSGTGHVPTSTWPNYFQLTPEQYSTFQAWHEELKRCSEVNRGRKRKIPLIYDSDDSDEVNRAMGMDDEMVDSPPQQGLAAGEYTF